MWAPQFLILVLIYSVNAYKILIVSPMPGKSHATLGEGLVRHLSQAGHEITYITAVLPEKSRPNVTIVDVGTNFEILKTYDLLNLKDVLNNGGQAFNLQTLVAMMSGVTKMTLLNPNVQQLLNDKHQDFDVIIAEWMFSEMYSGLQAIYGCPFIWLSTVHPHPSILRLIDECPNPAYNSDANSGNVPPFTFKQRLTELILQIFSIFINKFLLEPIDVNYYKTIIAPVAKSKGRLVPPFEELKYNASLVLGNSHVTMGVPTRLPENYKSIGGYHIEEEVKPLPENLIKLIESAEHGLIYFSMGSNLKSETLPTEVKQSLLKMFGELKQTVLWKFEEDLPNRPPNVHIVQWAPQQSILAHPNVRLFITHGGLLSIIESIHFGVPFIGIPVFGDQLVNVEIGKIKGYAKKVDLSYTMADKLKEAIEEMTIDDRYRLKIKELSRIYHDGLIAPGKELVHWVEHIIKTKGAPHLRSPALMMPWYQKIYLDLIILLVVTFYGSKCVICSVIRRFRNNTFRRKKIE